MTSKSQSVSNEQADNEEEDIEATGVTVAALNIKTQTHKHTGPVLNIKHKDKHTVPALNIYISNEQADNDEEDKGATGVTVAARESQFS